MLGQHHQFHHYNPGKSKFGEERYFKISKRIYQELDVVLSKSKFLSGKDYTIDYQVFDRLAVSVKNTERLCDYNSASPRKCISSKRSQYYSLADIKFYGEVYGGSMNPQEVEIALLIRSPEEHGTNPISQSFNIGNRVINTNDNYIRDSYSISAVVRNIFYDR